jgi:hypothetical protein
MTEQDYACEKNAEPEPETLSEIRNLEPKVKQGRKCKYLSDEERDAMAKEQRDNWRRKNSALEKNIKNESSPFQKQLQFYLRRNLLEPELEEELEELFRDKFVVMTVDTVPKELPNDVTVVIFRNDSKKVKTRLRTPRTVERISDPRGVNTET